ncbi:MAG: WYL domain-containing protein [Roseibium sp.]|uniref:helix-turn-helix transcriptional regulator n=1 Tax=Roseibium sp. TaxID=1936156 RepID=UPI001B0323C9|nr:WYL domain-containing protein [Roseibium sp.]MBO6892418.1 WYL domain-containing protein [Roseibium sp.]MBO6928684.1 WYL domain-containing protein [Roseibium sp.]
MARTDRLMRLMDTIRRLPQPVTAERLASESGVSRRQLYRDIATLRAGGALIDGAAGVGYTLTEDPALPPHSFTRLEIEALALAVSSLEQISDEVLADAAANAMARIIATLPDRQARQAMHTVMRTWRRKDERPPVRIDMDLLREAMWEEFSLLITYRDLHGNLTSRVIWPLGMSYGEETILLLAHCRLRGDFRHFHVSRIETMHRHSENFRPKRVGLLRDYVAMRRAELSNTSEAAG